MSAQRIHTEQKEEALFLVRASLYEAIRALTSELSLEVVLQKVADLSRELSGATYDALAVLDEHGALSTFITSGISARARERLGSPPQGLGVLGLVPKEGKPVRLADVTKHPQSVGFPKHHPKMKSFLGVPVVIKGRVVGDLYLTNKIGGNEFSQEDVTLVTVFASQAAGAIENARLFEMEKRRSAQLDVLNQIGKELTRIDNLKELLQAVSQLVQESFSYQSVQILWVDHIRGNIQVQASAGLTHDAIPVGMEWPASEGLTGWVVRNRESVLCNEVSEDPRYIPVMGFETSAEMVVPVVLRDEVVALINVNAMEPFAFDQRDVQVMETLADQMAVAIEKLKLHHKQEEQLQDLAVAEERERIGRDLHDGVIQSIYAVGLDLEELSERVQEASQEAGRRIAESVGALNQVIRDIRSYIMDLQPRELQGRRFDRAMESLIAYLEERTGLSVNLSSNYDLTKFPENYVVNLWHIFQEAFSNVEKYAQATRLDIKLTVKDGALNLDISDDGVGFDPQEAEAGRGYGLSNIKDRSERLGGILDVKTSRGKGTQLLIRIPYHV